jgi:hypothetical protein
MDNRHEIDFDHPEKVPLFCIFSITSDIGLNTVPCFNLGERRTVHPIHKKFSPEMGLEKTLQAHFIEC